MGTLLYLRVKFCLCSEMDSKGILNYEKKIMVLGGGIMDKVFFLQIISFIVLYSKLRINFFGYLVLLETHLVEVTEHILVSSSFFFHGHEYSVA